MPQHSEAGRAGEAGSNTAEARSREGAMQDAVLAAFAGDDVAAEFDRDKADAAQESIAAIEEPAALPGWGAWARGGREPECDLALLMGCDMR